MGVLEEGGGALGTCLFYMLQLEGGMGCLDPLQILYIICLLYIIYLKILKPLYRCTYFYVYIRKNSYTQRFLAKKRIFMYFAYLSYRAILI